MEKQEILNLIQEKITEGVINQKDLLQITEDTYSKQTPPTHFETSQEKNISSKLPAIFYGIGAIVAVVGIFALVGQFWDSINFFGRLLITLGSGLVLYVAGFLSAKGPHNALSQIFLTLSAILASFGVSVILVEARIVPNWEIQALFGSIFFAVYFLTYLFTKKNILILISIFYATVVYLAVIFGGLKLNLFFSESDIPKWAIIILGVSYTLLGYGLSRSKDILTLERRSISGLLYAFGSLAILLPGFMLGGVFDLLYILVLFGGFYVSVFVKSRVMLILSALFLVAHIGQITAKYFAGSFGWPIILIIIGFAVIGVGYATFFINKKYLNKKVF